MRSLIISYLLQCRECALPGIGTFKIIHTPASIDHTAQQLLPPFQTVIFSRDAPSRAPGLVAYISRKKNIPKGEAAGQLEEHCRRWKEMIMGGERLELPTLGTLVKNDGIHFERAGQPDYFSPLERGTIYKKERMERADAAIPALVEKAPPLLVKPAIEKEASQLPERTYWETWALILLAVGSVILFFHFREQGFNAAATGNQVTLQIDSAGSTYTGK